MDRRKNVVKARGAANGAVTSRLNQMRNQLRIDAHGRKYTPARTPRLISDLPWNRLVVTEQSDSSTTVTTGTTYNGYAVSLLLTSQMGIQTAALPIEMRFERVELWNMGATADLRSAVIMDVFALQSVTSSPIARLEDQPGSNQWACAGFQWPSSHQNIVFTYTAGSAPTNDVNIVRYYASVASSRVWIRFHLLWRFTVKLPPMLMGDLANLAI